MIQVWLLTFALANGQTFEGGQYQTEEQCYRAAATQLRHWRRVTRQAITFTCEQVML